MSVLTSKYFAEILSAQCSTLSLTGSMCTTINLSLSWEACELTDVVEKQSHAWTSHECMVAPGHMGVTTTHPQSQSRCSNFKLGVVSYLKCSLTTSVLESDIDKSKGSISKGYSSMFI